MSESDKKIFGYDTDFKGGTLDIVEYLEERGLSDLLNDVEKIVESS